MISHITKRSRHKAFVALTRTPTCKSRHFTAPTSSSSSPVPPDFTEQQHSDLIQNNDLVDPSVAASAPPNLELADARGNYLEDADIDFNDALPTLEERHKRYREEFGVDLSSYMRKTPMMSMDPSLKLPKLNKRAIARKKSEWEARQRMLASQNQSGGSYAAQRARYQRLRQQFAKPQPTKEGS